MSTNTHAILLVLSGWCVFCANTAAAIVVLPGFVMFLNRFQIEPEEEMLRRKFGTVNYLGRVRRRL